MAEGIREVRRLFQAAQNPPRWPMYIRQAKQFLRNVDASFDERKFGFASLVDLLRACQREGLFRIERDRQGVMRLFPGNIMQPAAGVPGTDEDDDSRGNVMDQPAGEQQPLPAEPEWAPRLDSPAAAEVVEGDVVQEIDRTPPDRRRRTPPSRAEAEAPKKRRAARPRHAAQRRPRKAAKSTASGAAHARAQAARRRCRTEARARRQSRAHARPRRPTARTRWCTVRTVAHRYSGCVGGNARSSRACQTHPNRRGRPSTTTS